MKSLLELKDKRQILKDEVEAMISNAEHQERRLNDEESATFEAKIQEIRSLDTEIENIEKNINNNNKMEEKRNFSLIETINDVINNRQINEAAQDIITRGKEEMHKSGQTSEGQIVIPIETRAAVQAKSDTYGGYAVQTDKWDILSPLYNRLVMAQAGATILTGCQNNFDIPAYGGTTVLWKGEIASAEDGAGTFTEVQFAPKRLTAYVDVSKLFLAQVGPQAEALLRQDIIDAVAQKLEATILGDGEGTSTQPGGVFYNVNADAAAASYADMIDDIKTLMTYKYNVSNAKFIMSPSAWSQLHTTKVDAGSGRFVLEDDKIDGVGVLTTGNAKSMGVALADWREFIIAQWGSLDITVDPYTQSTNGKVRLVVNAYFDANFRRSANYDVVRVLTAPNA